MSKTLWFALGVGSGVYAMVKTRRVVQRFTPTGIRYQLGAMSVGAKAFAHEVHEAMVEREHELREQAHEQRSREQRPALEAAGPAGRAAAQLTAGDTATAAHR